MKQRTIAKSVELVGIGLHKGVPVRLRLEPAPPNSGITFYRKDKNISIDLGPERVVDTKMATVIGKDGVLISTIEHFMSAVYSYGIDNLKVILDNDEVPVMDGSAISYCMLLDEAGICEQNASKRLLRIKEPVRVEQDGKWVELRPSEEMVFDFTIKFDHPAIGEEHYRFNFTKSGFLKEIAKARTFGFLKEVQYLRSIGLALGGSLDNAIVLDEHGIINPEGLRYEDEFVRHKILDAIGDLSLLGMPIMGEYRAFAASHHLNHLLTKELLAKEVFEVVEVGAHSAQQQVLSYAFAAS